MASAAERTDTPIAPRVPKPQTLARIAWALAAAAAGAQLVEHLVSQQHPVTIFALGLQVAGWALSRWRPWVGLPAIFIAPIIQAVFGGDPLIIWTIAVMAAFAFVCEGLSVLWVGIIATVCTYGSALISQEFEYRDPEALAAATSSVAAVALAAAIRAQRRWYDAVQEQAREHVAMRDLETTRRVAEERLRIARDLHDGVGHEIAALSMQLGIAEVSTPPEAQQAREALGVARGRMKSITAETRRILDVLRLGNENAELVPVADVTGIRDLVASYAAVGAQVEAVIGELPADIDRTSSTAAYRIVQEGLTNAARHGDGDVHLSVGAEGGRLVIVIRNAMTDAAENPDRGYGLVGMRERVQAANGTLHITRGDGVFTVTAELPIDAGGRA